MKHILATLILVAVIFALFYLTVRSEAHPLLIDAKADDRFCDFTPPPIAGPRNPYDYQPGRRRPGGIA